MPFVIISCWFVSGVIGGLIGQQHGKTGKGFALGFLLGPIGWAIMLFDLNVTNIVLAILALSFIGYFVVQIISRDADVVERDRRREAKTEEDIEMRRAKLDAGLAPSESAETATPAPTAAPTHVAPLQFNYAPQAPRRTPTPQEQAAEVARRYGSPK